MSNIICPRCGEQSDVDPAHLICKNCGQSILTDEVGDYDLDDEDFIPCDKCDGHPACEDYGCAIDHGLGHLVHRDNPWEL